MANNAKITLKTKAPATPQSIICRLFLGTKFAAINPIIIALSAAKIISIKIICVSMTSSSIKVLHIIKKKIYFQSLELKLFNI